MRAYERKQLWWWICLLGAAACRTDEGLAPRAGRPLPGSAHVTVLPASAYTPFAFPDTGYFSDVNDAQLMVGTFTGATGSWPLQAFAMQLGYGPQRLSNGPAFFSTAEAVNQGGEIAGTVYDSTNGSFPAVWRHVSAAPEVQNVQGSALDINDRGDAVGWMIYKGRSVGFFWDRNGNVEKLPPFPGGSDSHATAINIDNLVLGEASTAGGPTIPVIWTRTSRGWIPRALSGGIVGYDIDNAYNVVGVTSNRASYGNPDHVYYFGAWYNSVAFAVNQVGVAAGVESSGGRWAKAFVADWRGQVTYLPDPPGGPWDTSTANGLNNCGLVVGMVAPANWSSRHPAVWDPKC